MLQICTILYLAKYTLLNYTIADQKLLSQLSFCKKLQFSDQKGAVFFISGTENHKIQDYKGINKNKRVCQIPV